MDTLEPSLACSKRAHDRHTKANAGVSRKMILVWERSTDKAISLTLVANTTCVNIESCLYDMFSTICFLQNKVGNKECGIV
jgi:hypothetical protein